jgi:mutator protein MutT
MRTATPVNLIVLNKKNEVLLLRRKEEEDQFVDSWSIPGGGPEKGETYEQALSREIKEEIGCRIKEISYFKSYYYKVSPELHVRAIYFFGVIEGNIVFDRKEFSDCRWFKIDDAMKKGFNIAFNQKDVLKDFKSLIADIRNENDTSK